MAQPLLKTAFLSLLLDSPVNANSIAKTLSLGVSTHTPKGHVGYDIYSKG